MHTFSSNSSVVPQVWSDEKVCMIIQPVWDCDVVRDCSCIYSTMSRLTSHIKSSSANDCLQSAYKRGHSTETAVLKLTDDAFHEMDTKESTILVALDQSAAFDCVDHAVLLSRLRSLFGVYGLALNWFQSYLQ
jgi:hypothetical protein